MLLLAILVTRIILMVVKYFQIRKEMCVCRPTVREVGGLVTSGTPCLYSFSATNGFCSMKSLGAAILQKRRKGSLERIVKE